ncbi:MAG: YdjY domain-containing protein [Verrucomicrobia bacterium]|nr:YdjY domain-containing protein [Verrucomicrobiota bacterium]
MRITPLCWFSFLCLIASLLPAQGEDPYKSRPPGHDKNKQLAKILVLPGLIADKKKQRVEVLVESTGLHEGAACEFTIIGDESQHAYESLIISFAKPSAVHQALAFIGKQPGQPADAAALRFWAKGECFVLSILKENEPPFRLEQMVMDRRTGKPLPAEGFRFTGSRTVPGVKDPQTEVYAADVYQPMAIVSLFNSPYSVLEVPYRASKDEVYQNTVVNPELVLTNGGLLTLLIEPLNKADAKPVTDLTLQVQAAKGVAAIPSTGLESLRGLNFQLKDSTNVLNKAPSLSSVLEALSPLDRKKHDYFLTVTLGDDVELGSAEALARILSVIDCERGVRIEPPPAGQLHYRAFTPDRDFLDRDTRMYHPWELALSEEAGAVSGKLLRINSVWKDGASASELEITKVPVSGPSDLRKELDAEAERNAKAKRMAKPPVIMVFAPATLKHGQLLKFLECVLPTHKMVHVYVGEQMPPIPVPIP